MNDRLEAFIAEIEERPAFVAAAKSDPTFLEHLASIERCFEHVSILKDPAAIALTEAAVDVVDCKERTLQHRLLAIVELFEPYRRH